MFDKILPKQVKFQANERNYFSVEFMSTEMKINTLAEIILSQNRSGIKHVTSLILPFNQCFIIKLV